MGFPNAEYERCGWCGQSIQFGETSVTVNLNTERAVEESGEMVVDVLDGEVVLVLCEECGGSGP